MKEGVLSKPILARMRKPRTIIEIDERPKPVRAREGDRIQEDGRIDAGEVIEYLIKKKQKKNSSF